MKVLVVGGGGREHALVWKFLQDDPSCEILAAPGNAGIAQIARCIPVPATDVEELLKLAQVEAVDFTVVGPEGPLAAGIVDEFRKAGLAIFGPTRDAARIETSKRFAKELMLANGIPTAKASFHSSIDSAKTAVREAGIPVVIKASGLAGGKGVVVAQSTEEAETAVESMLGDRVFDQAGSEILVEEFMSGEELSVFVVTDGENFVMLPAAQDHKRLLDGDSGPNTGGMGSYSPVSLATKPALRKIADTIIVPTLSAMKAAGSPFTGLLYVGVMLTPSGPRVVEFNCRFGDPETETILPRLESNLLPYIQAVAEGKSLEGFDEMECKPGHAVTMVLAAGGYPARPRLGDPIQFIAPPPGMHVFHSGTALAADSGNFVTSGGRVLALTCVAPSLPQAIVRVREFAERIHFDGKQFRRDIGYRELERIARAT
ncbi:MAG: phosphoribosylamine--glycine ligase [Gemmatimonadaceae bacterium]|nr:phosphoribosylamine--glycine ligase [Gemmatimonadaceae bacterium]